jgi:hypothetical protein
MGAALVTITAAGVGVAALQPVSRAMTAIHAANIEKKGFWGTFLSSSCDLERRLGGRF